MSEILDVVKIILENPGIILILIELLILSFFGIIALALFGLVRLEGKRRAIELEAQKGFQSYCLAAMTKVNKLEVAERKNELLAVYLRDQLKDAKKIVEEYRIQQARQKQEHDKEIALLQLKVKKLSEALTQLIKERNVWRTRAISLKTQLDLSKGPSKSPENP